MSAPAANTVEKNCQFTQNTLSPQIGMLSQFEWNLQTEAGHPPKKGQYQGAYVGLTFILTFIKTLIINQRLEFLIVH